MRILSRSIFREVAVGALLGGVLFTFVLFLRKAGQLFAILVRSSAPPKTVAYLFSLTLPEALTFTVPLAVLVGVLLGLSRMSGDAEITAMRAAGVSGRRVTYPVLLFAFLATLVVGCCSLWLTPWAIRESYRVLNQVAAAQVTAEIQPRVFDEQFPRKILYVGDVIPGPIVRWRNVFLEDHRVRRGDRDRRRRTQPHSVDARQQQQLRRREGHHQVLDQLLSQRGTGDRGAKAE
jgi:lipopolysaccharide export LptBFGC system permease protein LptF